MLREARKQQTLWHEQKGGREEDWGSRVSVFGVAWNEEVAILLALTHTTSRGRKYLSPRFLTVTYLATTIFPFPFPSPSLSFSRSLALFSSSLKKGRGIGGAEEKVASRRGKEKTSKGMKGKREHLVCFRTSP